MAQYDDPYARKANAEYIRRAMNTPLLTREEEQDLVRQWHEKGNERALHRLIQAYMRLVIAMAGKFRHYGLPVSDLIQEGNVGLMQAAERFDLSRDVRFSTYAGWWIRAAMQDYVLRNWSIVRTGTTAAQKSLFFNLRHLRAKIEIARSESGLDDEGRHHIAEKLGVSINDVRDMEGRLSAGDHSLNAPVSIDQEQESQDLLADDRQSPEDIVIGLRDSQTRSVWLKTALGQLSPREQKIIAQRRLRDDAVTLEELGSSLGVSKERVRQLEHRALMKMRATIERQVSDQSLLYFDEAV